MWKGYPQCVGPHSLQQCKKTQPSSHLSQPPPPHHLHSASSTRTSPSTDFYPLRSSAFVLQNPTSRDVEISHLKHIKDLALLYIEARKETEITTQGVWVSRLRGKNIARGHVSHVTDLFPPCVSCASCWTSSVKNTSGSGCC